MFNGVGLRTVKGSATSGLVIKPRYDAIQDLFANESDEERARRIVEMKADLLLQNYMVLELKEKLATISASRDLMAFKYEVESQTDGISNNNIDKKLDDFAKSSQGKLRNTILELKKQDKQNETNFSNLAVLYRRILAEKKEEKKYEEEKEEEKREYVEEDKGEHSSSCSYSYSYSYSYSDQEGDEKEQMDGETKQVEVVADELPQSNKQDK